MSPDPDIDIIGAQDVEEDMQLNIGNGHVLYTGEAKGTDALAEEMAKKFGMQVEVLVPPQSSTSPIRQSFHDRSLGDSQSASHQAVYKLCKRVPSHFYTLQLLQRNYQIAKKAHSIYTFGTMEKDAKRAKGGTGWTVQLALDQGKEVYLFDIPSQTSYRSENYYQVNEDSLVTDSNFLPWVSNPPPFIKAVLWLVPEIWTRKPERKSKPYSSVPSVHLTTLNN